MGSGGKRGSRPHAAAAATAAFGRRVCHFVCVAGIGVFFSAVLTAASAWLLCSPLTCLCAAACLPACLPACPRSCLPARLSAFIPACLPLPACLPDDLSRQALMAQAEDLAVEDCLLVLEKALLTSKLTPEAYMKQVRG